MIKKICAVILFLFLIGCANTTGVQTGVQEGGERPELRFRL